MMNCKELTNDLLVDYADWQLAPHERNRVARHLDVCEPCQVRRNELEGMTGALRHATDSPPAALMAQLDRAVLGALPAVAPPAPRRRRPLAFVGIAAVLVVGLAAFFAGQRTAPRPEPKVFVRETPTAIPKAEPIQPKAEPALETPLKKPTPKPVPPEKIPEPAPNSTPAPAPVIVKVPPPVPAPHPLPKPGDLNGDGVVDIADARILQQMITQGLPLPAHADLNGDGVVDIADVREILRTELASR
jgi:hypothetical protein